MNKTVKSSLMLLIAICMAFGMLPGAAFAASDKTTKYRVYQNHSLLMEFADYAKAQAYAKGYTRSHVEEISTRKWLWHNMPRYAVYQYDAVVPNGEFERLEDAVKEAKNWSNASVRDIQSPGWAWNNYPRYRLYQGDITLDSWNFLTLDAAKAEAKNWGNAHIIELSSNRWIWDNLTTAAKQELRGGKPVYRVYQGSYTQDAWAFAYLEDAVEEALRWANSKVVNTEQANKTVFSNEKSYAVYQNLTYLSSFISIDEAADYARAYAHTTIRLGSRVIWTNNPGYTVYQNDNPIGEFNKLTDALDYAVQYSHSSIRFYDGSVIWDNFRKLLFWGWNGVSALQTIKTQTASTLGLDVDSPSWFEVADAKGGLKDSSSKEAADWLKKQGYAVHPLVKNPFNDKELTREFLNNPDAQQTFIQTLVKRLVELQVSGINVDFEALNGKDRAAFTSFMQKLTDAAHANGLIVSVDLPRGDVRWNAQTAFDHEKLAAMVDYIMTMTYDQYWSESTAPGSVAGMQWVEQGVQEFLAYGIPRDKLIMGIPFYVRIWTLDDKGAVTANRAVYMKDIPALIAGKETTTKWDESFKQYRVEFMQDGKLQQFWLEDEETVQARLAIAKKYDLAGVAAWRLGQEQADVWKAMLQVK
ncbi:glycosyl hydrolase family 18 protein [Paenibacillus sp. MBLB4367]|uniref:glycosyl hydrolase family 18 protein n=1 Tax=Paenibacillus sp. MBLB4367 TaxID=3384767 RepID=UPI0039083A8B